jgi:hypothetical protein
MAPWKLPLIVIAIVVPIVFGFYVGGPGVGVAVGALAAVAIVAVAANLRPRGAIGAPVAAGDPRRVLVVVGRALDDPGAIATIAGDAPRGGPEAADVIVLSPARIGFLDRWASDLEGARQRAQRRLVVSVAALAKAGLDAEAKVGDEDLVQAVEDQLQSFAATEVILVTGEPGEDRAADAAAAELERRLQPGFRRLVLSDRAG